MKSAIVAAILVILGCPIQHVDMAFLNVTSFFNLKDKNLTSVTWAHAVNSQALLKQALESKVMMLEADVVLGTITGEANTNVVPIMAHPPAANSDLSLDKFLNDVLSSNEKATTSDIKKGVKLDFKSIDALTNSVPIISGIYNKMTYPVWINADIVKGPLDADAPVDGVTFFTATKQYPNSTLSVGWTTKYDSSSKATTYTDSQISSMLDLIAKNTESPSITFPVRAGIAAESSAQMKTLLSNVTGSTLTIWSSEGDPVNVTKLREVIKEAGLDRVFVDVPADLLSKLDLQTIGGSSTILPAIKLLGIVLLAVLLF